jgi:hypothetical protein
VAFLLAGAVSCQRSQPGDGDAPRDDTQPSVPRFVRQIEWAETGRWLKVDTHLHTGFSDGGHEVAVLIAHAREHGCDAVAITDHADAKLSAATPEYAQAIVEARRRFPDMIILAGLEWNVPPDGGDTHATLLVPPGQREWELLDTFKRRFDDYGREQHDVALADEAMKWLVEQSPEVGPGPILFYNHPSRKRERSMDLVAPFKRLRKAGDLLVGFSGAPGHQASQVVGAYKSQKGTEKLLHRWDPAAARLGDAWDTLLADGLDVWAARAPSDFHNTKMDYWPGQFSETWLYAPDKSAAGVLKALRAGCFFGCHGHIVRQVELLVHTPGLPRPAIPGEVIQVAERSPLRVTLRFKTAERDWQDMPSHVDHVELIAITSKGAEIVTRRKLQSGSESLEFELDAPAGGVVLRARGGRTMSDNSKLMFYTNPIRVLVE